jgi:hypothetical protein
MPIKFQFHNQEITMLRKSILALILGMTPTPTLLPLDPTPIPDLPLSGTQSGTCPMMSGTDMTGMGNMSGMQGMQGMSGMGMSGMSGMNGMSGMQEMPGMNGMTSYPNPWYSDPWWLLGWVLLTLVVLAILAGAVYGFLQIIRRSKSVQPPASS